MLSMKAGQCKCKKGPCSPTGQCPTTPQPAPAPSAASAASLSGYQRLYDDSMQAVDNEDDEEEEEAIISEAPLAFGVVGLLSVSAFMGLRMRRGTSAVAATGIEEGLAQE